MAKKKTQKKKRSFRKAVMDYGSETLEQPWGDLSDVQRSNVMTRFYIKEVLSVIQPGIVPDDDEDIEAGITDGPNDQQVDAIFRNDGHVLIIQVKYRARGKKEDENDVSGFFDVLRRLHPVSGEEYKKSQRLADAISDIDWKNDTFELQYLTLGGGNEDIEIREREGQRSLPNVAGLEDIEDRCDLQFLSESELNDGFRDALSASQGLQDEIEIQFDPSNSAAPWIKYVSPSGRVSYIGKVKAGNLKRIYDFRGARYRIFALNIRNYVGDSSTNKAIISTAMNSPDDFFFFNNGISGVATSITPDPTNATLKCTRFSIINGAQTVRSLVKAFNKSAGENNAVSEAEVLMRVSEVSFSRKQSEKVFLEQVTQYNNTQNAIKISDFRSNDPIQISLSNKFARVSRGGKKYWYKNKRTGEQKPNSLAISLDEFTKTLHAFKFGPADMFGGTRYLYELSREGGYPKIFGDGSEVWDNIDSAAFKDLSGTWFLCEAARARWKNNRKEIPENFDDAEQKKLVNSALERRYLVYYAVGALIRERARKSNLDSDADIAKLSKPNWLDCNEKYLQRVNDLTDSACEILIRVYRSAQQDSDFVHRNWFRSPGTLDQIRTEIKTSQSMLKQIRLVAE